MLKVLVVDDETVVRRGIALGVDWASMGCVVVGEAANGEEGLLAAERYSPNLVITDIRMPKLDGIEMLRELRRRGIAHLPVVYSPEEASEPGDGETPPPGRRSVPGSLVWVPASAGLLLCQYVVTELIKE